MDFDYHTIWRDPSIEGIVFDCDGTLADTMPIHWVAWQAVTSKYQLTFSEDRFYSLGGVPPHEILQILSQEQGVDLDSAQVAHEKEELYLTYLDQVRPVKEVVSVAHARSGQIPMGVASGSPRPVLETVLGFLNLLEHFDAWVGGEEVERSKPAPDIFIEAARRIGVKPEKCLAYEDTDLGMRSAMDAGMKVIDVRKLRAMSEGSNSNF